MRENGLAAAGLAMFGLGLQALVDPSAGPVFGDAVLEAGWFDTRVMPLIYPPATIPVYGLRDERERRKAALSQRLLILHSRENYDALAGRGSPGWVRATVTVMLFGGWQKGRWRIAATMIRKRRKEVLAAIETLRGRRST